MKSNILISAFIGLLLTGGIARADWSLDGANSGLSFASIKKNRIGESNHFRHLEGRITDDGKITLRIDLARVETGVDIRNARLKEFFFQTGDFPQASLKGQIDMAEFSQMKIGDQLSFQTRFDFTLHGVRQTLEANLVILRLSENTVVVIPAEFIFINMEKFNLLPGLEKLKKLAKLPAISSSVPVTFHLTFTKDP